MAETVFKRKLYNEILEWKKNRSDKYALLIKGARRVGKSTIAEEFAKNEFRSYILIDFAHTSKAILELFDDTYNLDFFFLQLQQLTGVRLYEKESVIIFDEVQLLPKARQAIKYLVADGRYKYIETGSLLSIRKNTKDILIPSEEHKISMYPMDFEEFLWAVGDEITADTIKLLLKSKKSAGNAMHRNLMRMFRLYMLIGGMPQAVEAYLEHNNPKGDKINPIEVKSGNYRGHKSLDVFCDKYSSRIRDKYVVHTKDYKWENGIHYLPVYMISFL